MEFVLKYSGEDRDYFISNNDNIKPFEYVIHTFTCKDEPELKQKKIELFKSMVKRGLIVDNKHNYSHLRTINRDMFRLYILKEYKIDMVCIEKQMNEKYMTTYNSSDSDDEMEITTNKTNNKLSSSDEEENVSEDELI